MAWINKDDFIVFVDTILINPVGIKNAKVPASSPNTFLSDSLQAASRLDMVHALANGLAIGRT